MELPKHGLGLGLVTAVSILCLSSLSAAAAAQRLPGLLEALNLNGASEFAAALQANPDILDAAMLGQLGTVFAPIDRFWNSSRPATRVPLDATKEEGGWYQDAIAPLTWSNLTYPPDPFVVGTLGPRGNLGGSNLNQSIVLNITRLAAPSNMSSLSPRSDRYWTSSYAEISTGLGDIVHVINPNLEFAKCGPTNGVLHIVDRYFTVPQLLSDTAAQLPQLSIFTELLNTSCSCLKARLDNTPAITVFIPTDEAFAAAGITASSSTEVETRLLEGLVVPDFLGYTPTLAAQQQGWAATLNGSYLNLHVTDNVGPDQGYHRQDFYVNDARVVKPNIILDNGVAHVIDRLPSL